MILQTGGRASGATSTRSRSASWARRSASSTRTMPTCSPLGPTRRTSATRIRSLMRGSVMWVLLELVAGTTRYEEGPHLCPGRGPSSYRVVPATSSRSTHITEPRINDRIRVAEVRLVGPNGEQVGIVRVEDALRLAQDADLDLVEVAPEARPPVCKIMDYGKFKYEADMKAREARRNQTNTVLKEIRFRLKIDPHDYGTKKGHVERFLKAGDKVKVMIMFRGREQSRPEMGLRLLQRLADDVAELGFVESSPRQDGRNMIMVLGPTKKKSEVRSQPKRRPEAAPAAEAAPAEAAPAAHLGLLL